MSTTRDDLEDDAGIVVIPGTDTFHKSHPSALLSPACSPSKRGNLGLVKDQTERTACQHPACFGGDGDEP